MDHHDPCKLMGTNETKENMFHLQGVRIDGLNKRGGG